MTLVILNKNKKSITALKILTPVVLGFSFRINPNGAMKNCILNATTSIASTIYNIWLFSARKIYNLLRYSSFTSLKIWN